MAITGLPDDDGEGQGGSIFSDINITPLTDIFLVLLIIFMVTTTAIAEAGGQNGGIKVQLPKGGQANALKEVHDLAIAVLADGRTVVQGKVIEEAALKELLAKAHAENPDTLVLVQADEGVIHGRVVAVMDLARRQGLPRLAIATRAEGGDKP
ncbi:MAG TPA: biopolymer transporter ExbD [Anaeromyxobacteraceae bacterium]|nr:biopolymer transporter ExbD [Anaeromyxobacteraceae bacterium]